MTSQLPVLDFPDFGAFYSWLAENRDRVPAADVLVYHKGQAGLSYEDAVRAGLCWGWIDSVRHGFDERRAAQRFGPRRKGSAWSVSNVRRMKELIAAGLVREPGLSSFDAALVDRLPEFEAAERSERRQDLQLPSDLAAIVCASELSRDRFEALPPARRRLLVRWICAGKKDETRRRRARKAAEMLEQGRSVSTL